MCTKQQFYIKIPENVNNICHIHYVYYYLTKYELNLTCNLQENLFSKYLKKLIYFSKIYFCAFCFQGREKLNLKYSTKSASETKQETTLNSILPIVQEYKRLTTFKNFVSIGPVVFFHAKQQFYRVFFKMCRVQNAFYLLSTNCRAFILCT